MIFYFSGTGNTKWAAEQLALATQESLYYIPDEMGKEKCEYTLQEGERLGFCFPTHGWQPPRIVRDFIRKSTFHHTTYIYALTTCGDNMGHAMRIFNKELGQKGLHTDAVFAVVMPESNVCFSFLHLDTPERERQKIAAAKERMKHISEVVVVLPLLPVIQIILALVYLPANSISEIIGVPLSFNFKMSGALFGIPGLLMTSSAFKINSSV